MIVWDQVHTARLGSDGRLDVREVRAHVRRMLGGEHSFDMRDVDLLVCEITTNAVRHSASGSPGGGVRVSVMVAAARLRVEIQDDGGSRARPLVPSPRGGRGESGRGLMVVDGLADRWGSFVGERGLTVWFEVTGCT